MSKYVYYIERDNELLNVYRVNKKTRLFSSWDRDLGGFYDENENAECGPFTIYDSKNMAGNGQYRIPEDLAYIIAPCLENL